MTELEEKYWQGYADGVSDLRSQLLEELNDVLEENKQCYNNEDIAQSYSETNENIKGWIEALEMVKHSLLKKTKTKTLTLPVHYYDDGKYQDEPVFDFKEMGNTIEDVVQDKLGVDVIVTINEVE